MKSSMLALVCCATSILLLAQTENSSCEETGHTRLYKDVFSGDVMFTGKYKKKLLDDVMYEVYGTTIIPKQGVSSDGTKRLTPYVDIILDHNLQVVGFEKHGFQKPSYIAYLKKYMNKVEARLQEQSPDQVDTFKSNSNNVMQDLMRRFDDFQFFTGPSMDRNAMVVIMEYKIVDGVETPVLYFLKHGLVEENT